ncbi:MAG TPA: response regulator [Acidimicrobiales bacterium]
MALFRKRQVEAERVDDRALDDEVAVVREVLTRYPEGTLLSFGAPCRCPDCGDYGLAEEVNRQTGVADNLCHACGRRWVITIRALRAYRANPDLRVRPLPPLAESAPAVTWSVPTRHGEGEGAMRPLDDVTARFAANRWAPPAAEPAPAIAVNTEPVEPAPAIAVEPGPAPAIAVETQPVAAEAASIIDLDAGPGSGSFVVLVVDDNPFDVNAIEEMLTAAGAGSVTVLTAPTRADGFAAMRVHHIDVVLLTLDLPDSVGLATMVEWQLHPGAKAPIVAVVTDTDPVVIRGAKAAGACQVVQKRHLAQLAEDAVGGGQRLLALLKRAAEVLVSQG